MDNNRKYRSVNVTTLLMFIVIVAAVLWMAGRMQMHRQEMTYTEFSAQVEEDNEQRCAHRHGILHAEK